MCRVKGLVRPLATSVTRLASIAMSFPALDQAKYRTLSATAGPEEARKARMADTLFRRSPGRPVARQKIYTHPRPLALRPSLKVYSLLNNLTMANIKSSKKDLKRSAKKRAVNTAIKTSLKTFVKKTRTAIAAGDAEATGAALATAVSKLDKAAQRGILHKNAAARRKSRIAKAAAAAAKAA